MKTVAGCFIAVEIAPFRSRQSSISRIRKSHSHTCTFAPERRLHSRLHLAKFDLGVGRSTSCAGRPDQPQPQLAARPFACARSSFPAGLLDDNHHRPGGRRQSRRSSRTCLGGLCERGCEPVSGWRRPNASRKFSCGRAKTNRRGQIIKIETCSPFIDCLDRAYALAACRETMHRYDVHYFAALDEPLPDHYARIPVRPEDFPESPKDYPEWELKQLAKDLNLFEEKHGDCGKYDDYLFLEILYDAYKMRSDLIMKALKANDGISDVCVSDEWTLAMALYEAHHAAFVKFPEYIDRIPALKKDTDSPIYRRANCVVELCHQRILSRLMAYRSKLRQLAQALKVQLANQEKISSKLSQKVKSKRINVAF
jgi:hypothetical protein